MIPKKISIFLVLCLGIHISSHTSQTSPGCNSSSQSSRTYNWQINLIPAILVGTIAYALGGWIYQYVNKERMKNCRRETQNLINRTQSYAGIAHVLAAHKITSTSTEAELIAVAQHLYHIDVYFSLDCLKTMISLTNLQRKKSQEWHQFALEKDWISQQMAVELKRDIHILYKQAQIFETMASNIKIHEPFFALYFQLKYIEKRYQDELSVFKDTLHQFSREQLTAIIHTQADTHYYVKYPLLMYANDLEKILQKLRALQKKAPLYIQTQQATDEIKQGLTCICGIIQQSPLYAQQIQQKNNDLRFEVLQKELHKLEQNQQYIMLQNEVHTYS